MNRDDARRRSRPAADAIVLAWERFGLALILVAGALVRVALDWRLEAVLVVRDEAGYLANAAALAGYVFDGANSYHAGYSLLILPAFALFDDPATVYRGVQAINILLAASSVLILDALLRGLFPGERRSRQLLALALAAAYPAWFVFSPLAMSENGMAPAFCLAMLCCLRVSRGGGAYWLAWGLASGFLYFVHPTALGTLAAAVPIGAAIAGMRREWTWFAAFVACIGTMLVLDAAVVQPWLVARLSVDGYPPLLHYPPMSSVLQPFTSLAGLVEIARRIGGHGFYVLVGSAWLAWYATVFVAKRIHGDACVRRIDPQTCVLLFAVLAPLGVLALSALSFTALHGDRMDHWMYGRYVEGALMPALAIGAVVASRFDRALLPGMLVAAAGAALVSGIDAPVNALNVSALWELALAPAGPAAMWWLLGAVVAGLAWLGRGGGRRALLLAATFAAATIVVYVQFLLPCHELYARRYVLASYVREHLRPLPTCIGIDARPQDTSDDLALAWAKYGAHLFDAGMRRTTPGDWLAHCDGPLISVARDLDRRYDNVHLVAAERHDLQGTRPGPFLWMRGAQGASAPLRSGDTVPFTDADPRVPLMLGAGWHAPESAGTWSSASAELWIDVAPECSRSTPCEARFTAIALKADAQRPIVVDVSIEGENAGRWTVPTTDPRTYTLHLFHDAAFPSGTRVRLDVEGATSPLEMGLSADPRTLGIKLSSIALGEPTAP
ncbi:hypothetical protein [Dokdonella sp.]|uniref:hypothetical protein n=1 Tax=Dokdonella sp. TaxID=2291710 RepID=UPI002F3F4BFE